MLWHIKSWRIYAFLQIKLFIFHFPSFFCTIFFIICDTHGAILEGLISFCQPFFTGIKQQCYKYSFEWCALYNILWLCLVLIDNKFCHFNFLFLWSLPQVYCSQTGKYVIIVIQAASKQRNASPMDYKTQLWG